MNNDFRLMVYSAHAAMYGVRRDGVGANAEQVERAIIFGYMAAKKAIDSSESMVLEALAVALEKWSRGLLPTDLQVDAGSGSHILVFAKFFSGLQLGLKNHASVSCSESVQDDDLLNEVEVSKILGVARGTLQVWRSTNRYPLRYIKVGRLVKYRKSDVEDFLRRGSVDTGE